MVLCGESESDLRCATVLVDFFDFFVQVTVGLLDVESETGKNFLVEFGGGVDCVNSS